MKTASYQYQPPQAEAINALDFYILCQSFRDNPGMGYGDQEEQRF